MIKEIKHYYCDCCGKEIIDSDDVKTVTIPVTRIDHHDVRSIYTNNVDLCEECYEMLYAIINSNFAYMELKPFNFNVKSEKRWK